MAAKFKVKKWGQPPLRSDPPTTDTLEVPARNGERCQTDGICRVAAVALPEPT